MQKVLDDLDDASAELMLAGDSPRIEAPLNVHYVMLISYIQAATKSHSSCCHYCVESLRTRAAEQPPAANGSLSSAVAILLPC